MFRHGSSRAPVQRSGLRFFRPMTCLPAACSGGHGYAEASELEANAAAAAYATRRSPPRLAELRAVLTAPPS
jgi:hypothetical protein